MTRFSASMAITLISAASLGAFTTGCANHNEAEETRMQADQLLNASDLISKGQHDVEDGKAMVARGEAMQKNESDNVEGADMVARGNALITYGNAEVKQGEDMKAKAE